MLLRTSFGYKGYVEAALRSTEGSIHMWKNAVEGRAWQAD